MGNKKNDNPEKPVTHGTQDEDKQDKHTTQYVLDTTIRKPTYITSGKKKLCFTKKPIKDQYQNKIY